MSKSVRMRAEQLFSSSEKKDDQILNEKEKVERDKADHIAGLRALRLAKEAADKKAAAEKLTAKNR